MVFSPKRHPAPILCFAIALAGRLEPCEANDENSPCGAVEWKLLAGRNWNSVPTHSLENALARGAAITG